MIGTDPLLMDPEHGDYRLEPGSPAEGYGCQTFRAGPVPSQAALARELPHVFSWDHGRPVRTTIEVWGGIAENTIWEADTVRVVGDLTIDPGVSLTIRADTQVLFSDHYALWVQGNIQALGSPTAPIHFRSEHGALFTVDSTTVGSWHGIRFENTSALNDSSRFAYCIFEHCKAAGDSSRGAAFSLTGFSKLRVANSIFRNNVADWGAVAYCANFAAPYFVGCVMTANYAFVSGSALYCLDSYPGLTNCTIVGNHVLNEEIFDEAGVIHNHLSKSRPVNCIVRENPSNYFQGGQLREGKPFYTIYNDIEDYPGEGNFDEDPLFVAGGAYPFALLEGSPCIDAGTPDAAGFGLPPFDLAGQPRVSDGRVDVGAHEWLPTSGVLSEDTPARPPQVHLTASPNPLTAGVNISLALEHALRLRVVVRDITGRLVRVLGNRAFTAGQHTLRWDGRDEHRCPVAAGIYFCHASAESRTAASVRLVVQRGQ